MLAKFPTELIQQIVNLLEAEDLAHVSNCNRVLYAACQSDHLWAKYCKPRKSPAPFDSWKELYTTRWRKWSSMLGVWCIDNTDHAGDVAICRYDDKSGTFEFEVIFLPFACAHDKNLIAIQERPTLQHQIHPWFSMSTFYPVVSEGIFPVFAVPDPQRPFALRTCAYHTTHHRTLLLRTMKPHHELPGFPKVLWPENIRPTRSITSLPRWAECDLQPIDTLPARDSGDTFSTAKTTNETIYQNLCHQLTTASGVDFTYDSPDVALSSWSKVADTWLYPGSTCPSSMLIISSG